MLTIYLDKESIESRGLELINFNDQAFAKDIKDEFLKSNEEYIKKIDGSEYIGDFKIKSKFTDTAVYADKLSTGCKTVFNVLFNANNDKIVVNTIECGYNAINEIMSLDKGNIYIPMFGLINIPKTVKVIKNNKEYIVSNISELAKLIEGEEDEH